MMTEKQELEIYKCFMSELRDLLDRYDFETMENNTEFEHKKKITKEDILELSRTLSSSNEKTNIINAIRELYNFGLVDAMRIYKREFENAD